MTDPADKSGADPDARELVLATLLGEGADNVALAIFIYDDQGRYVAVNRRAAELLGYSREELLTRHVGDFTDGGLADASVLQRAGQRQGVRVVHRKDGSSSTIAYLIAPTRVATFDFHFGVVWELAPDDPRAAGAR